MKITKTVSIELTNSDIESLKCLFEFCTLEDAIRKETPYPKGYEPYQLKCAYELLSSLRDL